MFNESLGTNGSGKSTIVNILTRLYDVDEGQVLVDGHDIREYKISPLREAIATLTQDHNLYPLSIAENIGLGHPDSGITDMKIVVGSAEQGGALNVISKLAQGLETVLDPPNLSHGSHLQDYESLRTEWEKVEKSVDVSGT